MKLTLYYAPFTCALVPLITLNEAAAQFAVEAIALKNGQQRTPEYLRINPKGKVPALDADGELLTENPAILSFLARAFPAASLLPTEPRDAIRALSLMCWCAAGLHPPLSRINSPLKFCDLPGSEEGVIRLSAEEQLKNFNIVDALLAGRDWVFDDWTSVDAYLFWVWRRFGQLSGRLSGQLRTSIPPFPNYAAHGERMMKRASVQKALAFEKEVLGRQA